MNVITQDDSPKTDHHTCSFGEFVLDTDRGALQKEGVDVPLRPKSFDVLCYLVQHPGVLVTREQLLDAIWSGVVVTEDSLTQCLLEVRRALGDKSRELVRTVPRRGYLLDARVSVHRPDRGPPEPAQYEPPGGAQQTMLALVLLRALEEIWASGISRDTAIIQPSSATPNSIAVLPFVDMSPEGDQEYFADGISEQILNQLAQNPGLHVIARTSSFSFKGQNVDIATIANQLRVENVLEGSVRKDGQILRITAQLVSAANWEHLWSATYDRTLEDVFALQSEIADAVVQVLELILMGDE